MCEETRNKVDQAIIKKFKKRAIKLEKHINKEYNVIEEEQKKEEKNKEEIIRKFNMWKNVGLHTLTGFVSTFENDVTFILYSIEFTLRNLSVHLKKSAITKIKLMGEKEYVDNFKVLYIQNMPFTRMFIKALIKIDSVGLIICRRVENSIIKLVGRENAPFIIVLNTPPLVHYHKTYSCSWAIYKKGIGNEGIYIEGAEAESAGYAIIGSTTSIVIASKKCDKAMEFKLDTISGNFIERGKVIMPKYASIFIFDDSKVKEFRPNLQEWINKKKLTAGYRNWFSGQFILDLNIIVHIGGLYLSPPEAKKERGKLRLVFDCIPIAYILNKMGGKTTDGMGINFLKTKPVGTRDHSPFYGGSSGNVEEYLEAIPPD